MKGDFHFNPEAAKMYGVNEAIMLHHLVHWIHRNALNGQNEVEGKIWTWNSVKAFKGIFTFWSHDQIRRILSNLEKKGAIETGTHNQLGFDRTKWYTITAEASRIYELELPQHGFSKIAKRKRDKLQMQEVKSPNQYRDIEESDERNQIDMPWPDDAFSQKWEEWKEERKAHKRPFKTPRAEQTALKQLFKKSEGDLQVALEAIDDAIANQYQGIHPKPKSRKKGFNPDIINFETINDRAHQWGQ